MMLQAQYVLLNQILNKYKLNEYKSLTFRQRRIADHQVFLTVTGNTY